MAQIHMTRNGLEALKKELQQLKSVDRPAIIEAIAEARAQGDLSENAEYDAAKEAQGMLEARISKLKNSLAFCARLTLRLVRKRRLPASYKSVTWYLTKRPVSVKRWKNSRALWAMRFQSSSPQTAALSEWSQRAPLFNHI